MNNKLILTLVFVGFGVACGGDDDGARRGQQDYETVQEGAAAGVTSTIQGPGEALPPLTGTNADTTTAFTIDPNAVASAPSTQSAPGTLAGTMPPPISTQYPPPMTSSPATASPAPPRSRSTAPPVRTQPAPQREPAAQPPDTDTAVTPAPTAPPTQTAPPTNTAPPPPPRQEEEEEEEEEPPPPTSTDTRGGQR